MNIGIKCEGCDYTWFCSKEKWDANPDAQNPPCPNPKCSCHQEPRWKTFEARLPLWAYALASKDE